MDSQMQVQILKQLVSAVEEKFPSQYKNEETNTKIGPGIVFKRKGWFKKTCVEVFFHNNDPRYNIHYIGEEDLRLFILDFMANAGIPGGEGTLRS
jgi:hypothetical protein